MAQAKSLIPLSKGQFPAQDKVFKEFSGINTQAARQSIQPEQFSWLENVMPIGFSNLKSVPAASGILQTIPATVYYQQSYNIANTSYMFYACTDGSAYQVLLTSPWTRTLICAATTFPAS